MLTLPALYFFAESDLFSPQANHRDIASDCQNLDDKLDHIFSLYDKAANKFMQEGPRVSRSQFENMIGPQGNCKFDKNDISDLSQRHQSIIAQARSNAIQNSIISIEKIKDSNKVIKFCKELPKGGMLHMHPSGILDRTTVKKLGGYNIDKFFLPPGQNSFARFDQVFSPLRGLLGGGLSSQLKSGIMEYLERARDNKVIYVEFSKLFRGDKYAESTLRSWAQDFYNQTGIVVKWKAGHIRVWNSDTIYADFKSLIEMEYQHRKSSRSKGFEEIVGIDLYGNETNAPIFENAKFIYSNLAAMKQGKHYKGWTSILGSTAHAGELGDDRNPRDAMILRVDRIGHGVSLKRRPIDLEYALRYNNNKGLPIEINLVSNYRLSSVKSYDSHPFLNFLRLGLPVSLSTDDEGIFETTINTECEKAIEHFDIQYSEFKKMSYNSIETAFIDDSTKATLIKKLDQQFSDFEDKWSANYGK